MKHFFRSIFQLWTKSNLMLRILGGIILGTILALLVPNIAGISMLGTLFVGALKSIAPILVAVLVASSISRANQGLGSRFRVVIALYLVSTLMAAILSVLAIRIFPVDVLLRGAVSETQTAPGQLTDIFHNIIQNLMTNPLSAIINANYLSILLWAIVMPILLSIFTPQVLLLLYINFDLMGITRSDEVMGQDMGKILNVLMNKIFGLLKSIILAIKDKIVELLLILFYKTIAPLMLKFTLILLRERVIDWLIILRAALNCLPRFKFTKNKIIGAIDNVDYADIINTQNTPESTTNC